MVKEKNRGHLWRVVVAQRALIIMTVPILLYKILFSYAPIYGWMIAFQDFKPQIRNIFAQKWVGFQNFQKLFTGTVGVRFKQDIINSVAQSFLTLVFSTVCAILLSLMLNEVKKIGLKRVIQNITYMPHFLSWIIVTGLVSVALSLPESGGFINSTLMTLHLIREPIQFLAKPNYFWGIVVGSNLWKELGWDTILYIAAITAIDPTLYEAAEIDGAGRYRKMWNVTLPGIKATIVILIVMRTGYIMQTNFEIPYFLGNGLVRIKAETIDVFILRYGYQLGNYSLAVVAGMFKTLVGIIFVGLANFVSGRLGEETLV